MKTNCPYCGKIVATDFEVAIGQHVVCPWSERKFSYGEPRKKPTRIEVPKNGDLDKIARASNSVRYGQCPSLGSLIFRLPTLFRWAFRKMLVIRCSHCSEIDVLYVSSREGGATALCDFCGHQFEIHDGRESYLSWIGEIVAKISRRQAIDQENEKRRRLREEFSKQLKIFEDDWQTFSDPKAETKIARVKELTDRFYKKLSVANANKLYHAQHTNTRLMAMYESTDSVSTIISGVAAWMSSGKDAECEYGAKELQKMIERNEQAVDYFYALGEEFAGKEKDEVRDARLLSRVGYARESNLPADAAAEDVGAEENTVKEVNDFVRRKMERYALAGVLTIVIPVVVVGIACLLQILSRASGVVAFAVASVTLVFAVPIGGIISLFCESSYEAASEDFDSIREASTEHDCE